jgi:hypothetical protein
MAESFRVQVRVGLVQDVVEGDAPASWVQVCEVVSGLNHGHFRVQHHGPRKAVPLHRVFELFKAVGHDGASHRNEPLHCQPAHESQPCCGHGTLPQWRFGHGGSNVSHALEVACVLVLLVPTFEQNASRKHAAAKKKEAHKMAY